MQTLAVTRRLLGLSEAAQEDEIPVPIDESAESAVV